MRLAFAVPMLVTNTTATARAQALCLLNISPNTSCSDWREERPPGGARSPISEPSAGAALLEMAANGRGRALVLHDVVLALGTPDHRPIETRGYAWLGQGLWDQHDFVPEAAPLLIKGKRVLVTGGAGFVGGHLVDLLARHN